MIIHSFGAAKTVPATQIMAINVPTNQILYKIN